MYIAIRRYKTDPKLVDAVLKQIEESFMPVLRMSPGFVAYYAFKGGEGAVTSVSVFQDRESAEASSKSAANLAKMSLSTLLPNPPEVFHGPIACHSHGGAEPEAAK